MEVSLSVQPQEGASRIQSREDGSGGVRRGGSACRARRPSWLRRALGKLLMCKQPAAVEAPAPARARQRAPTESERPRWRSSLKAMGSALARVMTCICKPAVCAGVHDDDVVDQSKRRRRRRSIRSGARSPPVAVLTEESDDYWTFAFRGRRSLDNDVLMRRFVAEEDAMRRRLEMRVAAGYGLCWFPPGPSRLSQMSLADDDDNDSGNDDDEAGENRSTSPQCSEAQFLF